MIDTKEQWNPAMKDLKAEMAKKDVKINKVRDIMVDLHGYTHSSSVSGRTSSLYDELWSKRENTDFTSFTENNIYSIAWHLWHASRIEDITCSYFISDEEEILFEMDFANNLSTTIRHTGNSMDFSDMEDFNNYINLDKLHEYRCCVGKKTRYELEKLTKEKLREKVDKSKLPVIIERGSVIKEDEWLLSFWGKKNIFGIVTMPLTRHLLVHLNSAHRIVK